MRGNSIACIFIDIDNYLLLCNNQGIACGRELLKRTGVALRAMFYRSGFISRIHRDEFAVFIERPPDEETLNEQLRILCKALCCDVGDEDDAVAISASLGVIISSDSSLRYDVLSGYGLTAVHNAKRLGGSTYSYYSPDLEKELFGSLPSSETPPISKNGFASEAETQNSKICFAAPISKK